MIRLFAVFYLAATAVGLAHGLIANGGMLPETSAFLLPLGPFAAPIVLATRVAFSILFVWAIVRHHSRIVKWLLLLLFAPRLLSLPSALSLLEVTPLPAILWIFTFTLHGLALAFLFSGGAREWFLEPKVTETDVFR